MKESVHPAILDVASRDHEISRALAEFAIFVIDKYDTEHESSKNQIFVKGVFSGASCRGLVDYARKMRLLAQESMSLAEIAKLATRSSDGKNASLGKKNERT